MSEADVEVVEVEVTQIIESGPEEVSSDPKRTAQDAEARGKAAAARDSKVVQDEEEGDNDERFSNVSSAIMLNLPTSELPGLRTRFEAEESGLRLHEYLQAIVPCMNLRNYAHLVRTVADLVDFFMLVDINGDGFMEWDEFTTFIIDQVVGDRDFAVHEKLFSVGHSLIQSTSTRFVARTNLYIPSFSKIFVGVGQTVQLYGPDHTEQTWTNKAFEFDLADRGRGTSEEDPISVLDMAFVSSKDMLIISRSDFCFELIEFLSRTTLKDEMMENVGLIGTEFAFDRIQISEVAKEKARLFAIGASFIVHVWDIQPGAGGKMELVNHTELSEHTDYVRDILVIDIPNYQFFASGGMDQKVHLYDLVTLRYRTVRTGFTSGVQCLAFDGKHVLLGGSFDYQIIGWDLDQHIDRPLFRLLGHTAPVCRIVAMGHKERAFSLDDGGTLRLWDTTRSNPIDGLERIIDSICVREDPMRSFDVIPKLGAKFSTMHGSMVCAHGKKQHTFRLQDTTKIASPPLRALFSYTLMSIISIHSKDIMFWNASMGYLNNRMQDMAGTGEITSATLDDRSRKAIIGNSLGEIEVFNCLNGAHLKTIDASQNAIRHMIYTPDKVIIAICSEGELLAIDEFPNGDGALTMNVNMRETRAHEVDVVSMAYSHKMGLVATVDCTGTLMVWDYQYWIVVFMLHNCTGGLSDACEIAFLDPFPLLLVSNNECGFTVIPVGPAATRGHTSLYRLKASPRVIDSAAPPGGRESDEEDDDDMSHTSKSSTRCMSLYQMRKYVAVPHEPKSMMVLLEELDNDEVSVGMGSVGEAGKSGVAFNEEGSAVTEGQSQTQRSAFDGPKPPEPKEPFPTNFMVRIVCGQDDGTIAVYDISEALREIGEGEISPKDYATQQPAYDPRRRTRKAVRQAELEAALVAPDEAEARSYHLSCTMTGAWDAHTGAVTDTRLIGDFRNIMTAGEDNAIYLWTMDGSFRGALTRGRDMDKVMKLTWKNPVDMTTRDLQRRSDAGVLIDKLKLRPATYAGQKVDQLYDYDEMYKKEKVAMKLRYTEKRLPDIIREDETAKDVDERTRVIDQMRGKVTYQQSAKELAMDALAEQHAKALQAIRDIGKPKKKKKKKELTERVANEDDQYLESVNMPTDHVYNAASVYIPKKAEKNSAIAQELADIEANDPNNWSITSTNRQRQLYAHMFREMDKAGLSEVDPMEIIKSKLDSVSPGGDFEAYFTQLVQEKAEAKRKAKEEKRLAEELAAKTLEAGLSSTDDPQDVPPLEFSSPEHISPTRSLSSPHPRQVVDRSLDRALDPSLSWNDSLRYNFYKAVPSPKGKSGRRKDDEALTVAEQRPTPLGSTVGSHSTKVDMTLEKILSAPNLYDAVGKDEKKKVLKSVLSEPALDGEGVPRGPGVKLAAVLPPPRPDSFVRSWDKERQQVREHMKERRQVLSNFDSRMDSAEIVFRRARKVNKRAARSERKRLLRKAENITPTDIPDSLSVGSLSVSEPTLTQLSDGNNLIRNTGRVRRHIASALLADSRERDLKSRQLMMTRSESEQAILQMKSVIQKKASEAERRWVRKVRYALGDNLPKDVTDFSKDDRGPVYAITAALEINDQSTISVEPEDIAEKKAQQLELESVKKKRDQMLVRIQNKRNFGEYSKRELLRFWKIWSRFELTRKDGVGDDDSSSLGIQHFRDDDSAPQNSELDSLLQTIRKEESALNSLANHDGVFLEALMATKFIKSSPSLLKELNVIVTHAITDNIPVPTIVLSLNEALSYLYPFMNASERMETIRMYALQPKKEKVEEKEVKNVNEDDIRRMRIMFDYMDTDRSGYVDKDEIVAALINDSEAIQEEFDKADEERYLMGEETNKEREPKFIWTEEKIVEMVSAVDEDGNMELDLVEFIELFSNIL